MNPDASRLNDPQCASDRMALQNRQKVPKSVENTSKGCLGPTLQDDGSSALFRWKSRDLTEIAVEGYKRSFFGRADLEKLRVANAAEALIRHRHNIMA